MEKPEFRVMIKHYFLMEKNTIQAKQWLDKCYPDSAPSRQTVEKCYADFKLGLTNTDDAERSDPSNSSVVPENIKKVHKMVLADRKLKLREITDTLKISEGSVLIILHEHLRMRMLCSKWVPRLLIVNQKQQRFDNSERCLELFERNKKDIYVRYVTRGENRLKRSKTQMLAGKILASVFCDAHGILFIDCLEKGRTIAIANIRWRYWYA